MKFVKDRDRKLNVSKSGASTQAKSALSGGKAKLKFVGSKRR